MLVRLDCTNNFFAELEEQWRKACETYEEDFAEYAAPAIDHARTICAEDPADVKYGIYALKEDDEYLCLMHANWARLPRTDGKTVRVLWVLLAPKYDFEDVRPQDIGKITADLILGTVELANGDMDSDNIKIHIGNMLDRQYFAGIAAAFTSGKMFKEAKISGNWLQITL